MLLNSGEKNFFAFAIRSHLALISFMSSAENTSPKFSASAEWLPCLRIMSESALANSTVR